MFADADTKALTKHYAEVYRDGVHTPPDTEALKALQCLTDHYFKAIPVKVTWQANDPYPSWEAMALDIQRGRFKVRCNGFVSNVFGHHYQKFRAVHDWYGHYEAGQNFGLVGELAAFGVHAGQFPPMCWPMIFNELVLVNSFKEHYGFYSPEDKLVCVPQVLPVKVAA